MPKPDVHAASVVVGCEGPEPGIVRGGPMGNRRRRDGAELHCVRADCEYWLTNLSQHSVVDHHVRLIDPSRQQVLDAIVEASAALDRYETADSWLGGQIDFVFSGHGTADGSRVVSDGAVTARDLVDAVCARAPHTGTRRLAVVLDSCFSALPLAQILTDERHRENFLVIDGFAAVLQDEYAWEIDSLGHGPLTFTHRNRGTAHVRRTELARAVRQNDDAYLRFALQAYVPNPVTYLTEGDQTSVDVINGYRLEVMGGGALSLLDVTLPRLLDGLLRAREADCDSVIDV